MIFSFNDSKSRTLWQGFTFRWYQELFSDKLIMHSLYITLSVALIAAVAATVIGTFAAIGIYNLKKAPKAIALGVNIIPVMNPDIITGISLMLLFLSMGMNLGFYTLLLAHITFNIPYVILSILPKLRQMNRHLFEAALDLGASPSYAFRRVVIPEILPGSLRIHHGFYPFYRRFRGKLFHLRNQRPNPSHHHLLDDQKRVSPEINALSHHLVSNSFWRCL
jgi:spermidine/putrescine transport system permease protein